MFYFCEVRQKSLPEIEQRFDLVWHIQYVTTNNNYMTIVENILLLKITAVQNEVALTYNEVRRLCLLAVVYVATIIIVCILNFIIKFMI